MGWKWNDLANLLRDTGLFTEQQILVANRIATEKKWELVDILEAMAHKKPSSEFDKGHNAAVHQVIAGVKPNGRRP